jgi:DNA-binding Lrp family transcriptional regulator
MERLLTLLRQNARASLEELARELHSTPVAVGEMIAKLEQEGVILGYQTIVDGQTGGGSQVTAVVEVRITPEREGGFDRLANRIAKFSEVQSCYLMSGGYDLLVIAEGATLQEIATFISEKLATIKGVLSTQTHFRLKSYKENGVSLTKAEVTQRLAVAP